MAINLSSDFRPCDS